MTVNEINASNGARTTSGSRPDSAGERSLWRESHFVRVSRCDAHENILLNGAAPESAELAKFVRSYDLFSSTSKGPRPSGAAKNV
jgi:hypothetical protein